MKTDSDGTPVQKQLFHTRVALVLPDIPVNPATIALVTGVARVAENSGYHLTLTFVKSSRLKIEELVRAGKLADELISFLPLPDEVMDRLRQAGVAVRDPALSRDTSFFSAYAIVASYAGNLMADHIITRGRRHLAFVCPDDPVFDPLSQLRYAGVIEACLSRGIKSPIILQTTDKNEELAGLLVEFMRKNPEIDGFLCHNDLLAIQLIQSLRLTGRSVPQDVAVIGAENTDEGALTNPTLTSVAYDTAVFSELLGYTFVANLRGEKVELPSQEELESMCYLVARESA